MDEHPQNVHKVTRVVARSAHWIMRRMNTEFIELSNYLINRHGRY